MHPHNPRTPEPGTSSETGDGKTPKMRRQAIRAGELVAGALKEMGVPSRAVGERLTQAWSQACDPSWVAHTRVRSHLGGVMEVAVDSASLREELAQFHRERLLGVLQTSMSGFPLIGIRFTLEGSN
jgi:hypothetical protein